MHDSHSTPAAADAVTLDKLDKQYGGSPILSDICVSFPAKSVTAIIGRSGSGKSTLLRMVNGLAIPDRGSVTVLGKLIDYDELMALRRSIGYAVQGVGLFPHLTAAENITLNARLERWPAERVRRRLERLQEIMQLDSAWLNRYPRELSGGQQQRVGLARAMMLDPPLLLLDEPFAALDPLTRLDIHDQLQQLQTIEPRCILLVTHDMREAMKLGDHLLVLEAGRVLLKTDAAALRSRFPDVDADRLLLRLLEQAA